MKTGYHFTLNITNIMGKDFFENHNYKYYKFRLIDGLPFMEFSEGFKEGFAKVIPKSNSDFCKVIGVYTNIFEDKTYYDFENIENDLYKMIQIHVEKRSIGNDSYVSVSKEKEDKIYVGVNRLISFEFNTLADINLIKGKEEIVLDCDTKGSRFVNFGKSNKEDKFTKSGKRTYQGKTNMFEKEEQIFRIEHVSGKKHFLREIEHMDKNYPCVSVKIVY